MTTTHATCSALTGRATLVAHLLLLLASAQASAQSDYDLRERVSRLARIGSCTSPSFSPDGETLAFVSDLSGEPQVWTVPAVGGWPTKVTELEDTVGGVEWSPDGRWLAVSAAPGGGMNQQVYLVSPDGARVRRITPGGVETNWLGPWSPDAASLAFGSNVRGPAAMDSYLYELAADAPRLVARNPGTGRIVDLSGDGTLALLSRVAGRGSNDLYLVELASGTEHLLTPHEGPGSFFGVFGAGDRSVLVGSNLARDRIAFGTISIASPSEPGLVEILRERDDAELESLEASPAGGLVALVWNVGGRSELELFDLEEGEGRVIAVPVDRVIGVTFSVDGRRLAFAGGGAASPFDVYVATLPGAAIERVTSSPHAGVDLAKLVRPELVRFASHDGLALSGWLYRPPGAAEPGPYVLSFHGGPEGQERPQLRSVYQALLQEGIGVFAPNIRGSSGFGKRFVNLDNRELRFDANRDIASSAEYLVAEGIADGERLGIMGGSYGGYAVMVAVTEFPDLFAAAVNLYGMVNFETFFAHTEPWMAAISGTEYGDPETELELLRRLSPIHKLDRVRTPLLVQHGANDTNVPVVEAEQVVEALKRRGVPVDYVLFPDEGHGFRKADNRVTSTVATVEWFVEYLARKE